MATSSIFANIVINDVKGAEVLANALDCVECDEGWEMSEQANLPLRDIDEIRKLMSKRGCNGE